MSDFRLQYAKMMAKTDAFAAWDPVANNFAVGDYGFVDKCGIFQKLGNLQEEHGIEMTVEETSTGKWSIGCDTSCYQDIQAATSANVPLVPDSGASATMSLKFSGRESCLIRTQGNLIVRSMGALPKVAKKVFGIPNWDHDRTYIVRRVYIAESPLICMSSGKNAEVKLAGSVDALAAIRAGSASAGVHVVDSSGSQYQQVAGQSGPVALHLFRVKRERRNPEKHYIKFATPRPGKPSCFARMKRRTPTLPPLPPTESEIEEDSVSSATTRSESSDDDDNVCCSESHTHGEQKGSCTFASSRIGSGGCRYARRNAVVGAQLPVVDWDNVAFV